MSKTKQFGTFTVNGTEYYRTRIKDQDGNRITLYAKTPEELCEKVEETKNQIENKTFCRTTPTVREYCEKWLLMQSANVRQTTLIDYTSKVKNYIIKPLGDMHMADVTLDDIRMALVPASKKSESVFKSVNILFKCIFSAAKESRVIKNNPTTNLSAKGGGVPQSDKIPLTDEQAEKLIEAVKDLPPYVFVMLGLYAGLRREEILGLQWDCVFLDVATPYISVRRAWRSVHNRPVISTELKSPAAKRDIPIPQCLVDCLQVARSNSISDYVVADSKGEPLSYSQFQRVWKYIEVRTAKERKYYKYVNGQKIVCTIHPELGSHQHNNPKLVYSLDFDVTPHQLRHTYITNLIYYGVDPKTVQYLAGHDNSKTTIDIYAKVKYNKPNELISVVNNALK